MTNAEIRETLEKQLQLLSERSKDIGKHSGVQYGEAGLAALTNAMLDVADALTASGHWS